MTTPNEPKEPSALEALAELYSDSTQEVSAAEMNRGLDSLLARVSSGTTRRRRTLWPIVVAALGVCVVVAVPFALQVRKRVPATEQPALTYKIDGGRVLEGGYLRELGHAGVNVTFNEGTEFKLAPGTRGRIRELAKEGARVAIEHGTAAFSVTPGTGRRWLVDVGPFSVTVKGTVFSVSWDPLSEQFALSLRRGLVVVSGPVSAGEIALRSGQHLSVNLVKAETVITDETAEEASSEASTASVPHQPEVAESSSPAASSESTEPAAARPPTGRAGGEPRWREELSQGRWDSILQDVKRIGVEAILAEASSEDLFAVADAARYRRQPDLARSALLALRRRFPHSSRALDATFLLGRLEEARVNGAAQAIARYDEYLSRAPNGPFAGEALGRKMSLTDSLEGPARARPIAEEYLRRFPKGSYAGSARTLVRVQ